jgi:hypothetical protein
VIVRVTKPSVPTWTGYVVPCHIELREEGTLRFTCVTDRAKAHEFTAEEAADAAEWMTQHHRRQGFRLVCHVEPAG